MIHDFLIIKDGLPLFVKHYISSNNAFTQGDNLIMVSGFFSALNSFSDSFDDLGTISELKLSNNELKLSFLMKFNINEILNWNGRRNTFNSFESILNQYIEEEKEEKESEFKDRVVKLIKTVEDKLNEESSLLALKSEVKKPDNLPEYCDQIPRFTSSMKVNPKNYLTGDSSFKIFYQINGKKTISDITEELNLEHKQVYNICKNLIKLGFIKLF